MNKINFFGLFASKYLKQYEKLYSKKEKKWKNRDNRKFCGVFTCSIPALLSLENHKPHNNGTYEKLQPSSDQRKNRLGFKLPKMLHSQRTDTSWELPAKVPVTEFLFFLNWRRACSVRNALFESMYQKTKQTNKSSNKLIDISLPNAVPLIGQARDWTNI